MGSHYLFKEPGGWVGIKDGGTFEIVKKERRKRWEYYINKIKTFDLLTFCHNMNITHHIGLKLQLVGY